MQSGRLDSNQWSPVPDTGGMAKLSYVLIECAQPESNRHTLHGKQEGCHYIMGAKQCQPNCQRTSEHRAGLEPASSLYESRAPIGMDASWSLRR